MTKNIKKKFKTSWESEVIERRVRERENYFAAPSAGPGIIKIYKELLKKAIGKKKNFKALVLGATPELRDLVLEKVGELVTIDISWEMIKKATSLMKYQNHPREIIVKADWLDSPLRSNNFDVILGDGPFANLSFLDQNRLFKEIKRLLKPRSFVILRDFVRGLERKIRRLEEIDLDFGRKEIHWFDLFFDSLCYSDIVPRFYNPKTGLLNIDKFLREFLKAYSKRRISKKSLEACEWAEGSGVRTLWPKPKFEKLFKKYFKLISVKQAKDYKFTQDTMIFFFGKNKK